MASEGSEVFKKYKRQDINYTKLEIKRGKAKDLMTMLKATSAKTGPLNNTEAIKRLTKYRSNKFTEGMEYMKKKILKSQKKLKLHSTGGLSAATPHGYLAGGLLTKGVKTAYKLAKQKYPRLFTSKALSMIRDTKTRNYSQLKQLGFDKGLKPKQLRKMAVSEVLKERLNKLKRLSITHHNKAAKIVKSKMITPWNKTTGKAKAMFTSRQYRNIHRYDRTSTQKKLDALRTSEGDLSVYQESIKAKRATKHALGGEVVIGKNVDGGLL